MKILDYKPHLKEGYLKGFVLVEIDLQRPNGDIVQGEAREVKYFEKGDSSWISFPSREYEKDGKKHFWPYFKQKEIEEDIRDLIREHLYAEKDTNVPF